MWTERRLIEKLAALFCEGVVITRRGLIEGGHAALVPVVDELGGFSRVRRLAHLQRQQERRRGRALDGPAVIAEIQQRRRAGAPLTGHAVPGRLRTAAMRAFGSWRAAIAAAGYRYLELSAHRKYSDDDLLAAIRALVRDVPSMTYAELRRHALADTLRMRFGSLRAALTRAGHPEWAPSRRQAGAALRSVRDGG